MDKYLTVSRHSNFRTQVAGNSKSESLRSLAIDSTREISSLPTSPSVRAAVVRDVKSTWKSPRPVFKPYSVPERRGHIHNSTKQMMGDLLSPLPNHSATLPSSVLTRHLLETLPDKSNPITHSDIYERSDHVVSAASGHQRSEGRLGRTGYLRSREVKLKEQRTHLPGAITANKLNPVAQPGAGGSILQNTRVYISGYLANTTDIEVKRIVALAGGQILQSASGATHILTSQHLSGTKAQRLLATHIRHKVHVVRPEWVVDSVKAKKRLPEWEYAVIRPCTLPAFFPVETSRLSGKPKDSD